MLELRKCERLRAGVVSCLLTAGFMSGAHAASFELNDGLRWTGDSDAWRVELDGRVHLDAADYSSGVTPLDSGTSVRRLRPSLKMRIDDRWRVRLDYEFADIGSGWKNAWVDYRGLDHWRIRVGNQLAPFGLEQQMSSNSLPLLERSVVQALTPAFERGVSANYRGSRWQMKTGVFEGDVASNDARRADGTALTSRFTFAPVYGDSVSLHFGASVERRNLDQGDLRFRVRPESSVDGQRLVDTAVLTGAERLTSQGIEAALVFRRCRVIGEYVRSTLDFGQSPSAEFDGGYAALGCLIGGEGYRYNPSSGGFRSPRATGRLGVVELTLRDSHVNLTDAGIFGGKQHNRTFGASWQITDNIRVLADYIHMNLHPNKDGIDETADAVQARFQAAF